MKAGFESNARSTNDSTVEPVDVLVVGAGMAGLAFAAALQHSGLRIVVVDPVWPDAPEQWPHSVDPRVSALSSASQTLLQALGAWDVIAAQRFSPYQAMEVWDGDGTASIALDGESLGESQLGVIVENRVIVQGLLSCLTDTVKRIVAGLAAVESGEEGCRVRLSDGQVFAPALLVGADGARSLVREQVGLRTRRWSYEQAAVVTTVQTELPHGEVARQVFRSSGPLAFLPLPEMVEGLAGRHCSIVWSLDEAAAEAVMQWDDAEFCARLAQAFEGRLGEVEQADRRFSFPLHQLHAVDYVRPGVALIGDAAHVIHPLAGQGINLGFLDAAVLAEEVAGAVARGLAPGEYLMLRRFQRRRKPHNLATMAAMEGFKRLFGASHWSAGVVRNAGMRWVDRQAGVKSVLIGQAMGLTGDLPALARRRWQSGF